MILIALPLYNTFGLNHCINATCGTLIMDFHSSAEENEHARGDLPSRKGTGT